MRRNAMEVKQQLSKIGQELEIMINKVVFAQQMMFAVNPTLSFPLLESKKLTLACSRAQSTMLSSSLRSRANCCTPTTTT